MLLFCTWLRRNFKGWDLFDINLISCNILEVTVKNCESCPIFYNLLKNIYRPTSTNRESKFRVDLINFSEAPRVFKQEQDLGVPF